MAYHGPRTAEREAVVFKARPSRTVEPESFSLVGAWEWNLQTGEFLYSPTVFTILGTTPDRCPPELDGLIAGIHPEDRERVCNAVNCAVQSRDRFEALYRIAHTDGAIRWIESRADLLLDFDGRPHRYIGTVADVTEREEERNLLARRERQLRDLIEVLPAAVYITDAQGRIVLYNHAATEMWGRKPELGVDLWCGSWRLRRSDGTPMPHDDCPMAVALREDRPVRGGEAIAERPDGTWAPFMAYPTPLHDHSGAMVGAVNMLVDISERKEMEEERALHLREVEALNARLQRAMAETHHRVKNNLQVISAIIDMMASQAEGPIPPENVRTLSSHVRALAIVHDLLTKAAKGLGDTETVSSQDILSQLLPLQQQSSAGHEIESAIADIRLPIRSATSLALITNELVQNGIKYGKRIIRVQLTRSMTHGCLVVADDGPGLPRDFRPETLETTGVELVRSLSRWDLGGTVVFGNGNMGGAEITVTFPLSPREAMN